MRDTYTNLVTYLPSLWNTRSGRMGWIGFEVDWIGRKGNLINDRVGLVLFTAPASFRSSSFFFTFSWFFVWLLGCASRLSGGFLASFIPAFFFGRPVSSIQCKCVFLLAKARS